MPFEFEHAARLKNPGTFDPNSFRRLKGPIGIKNRDGERVTLPETAAAVMGKPKNKNKKADPLVA